MSRWEMQGENINEYEIRYKTETDVRNVVQCR